MALPLFVEAVRVEGDFYVDGGVIDAFPAEPLVDDGGFDRVFGLNVILPPGLRADDISGWERRPLGLLDASRQVDAGGRLELARRSARRLGDRLTLVEPLRPGELRGWSFFDTFLDRRRWPDAMRRGYDATVAALDPLRRTELHGDAGAARASGS